MEDSVSKLLEVQDKDMRIANLKRQIESVPQEKAKVEAEMENADSVMDGAKKALQEVEMAIKNTELEIATVKQKKLDLLGKSHQIKKNDEYKAMLHEVELFDAKIAKLEDNQLELWEKMEGAKEKRAHSQKQADAMRTRLKTHIEDLETRARNCEQQVSKVQAERAELVKDIDVETIRLYERLVAKASTDEHYHPVLVPLDGEMCGACRLKVVPQVRVKVQKNAAVCCENCGAMLYNPDA